MKFVLVFVILGYSGWRTYRRWQTRIPPAWRAQVLAELGLGRSRGAAKQVEQQAAAWYRRMRTRALLFMAVVLVLILWTKLYRW